MPNHRLINQANLTAECWDVQFDGLKACETCEFKNTSECGGQRIRETGKNNKGLNVPIGNTLI